MSDYIERKDAEKWLTNLREDCGRYQDLWHYAEALDQIIELLSADVAPVRLGRWALDTAHTEEIYAHPVKCSVCGQTEVLGYETLTPYCPHCGAKMDGGED